MENDKFMDPFVGDGVSVAMSQNGSKKLTLKIAYENRGIKKIRENPNSFEALMKVIAVQTKDPAASKASYQIEYMDDAGDVIILSDDEDLAAAYEWAETQPANSLKLDVKPKLAPRKKTFEEDVEKKITEPMANLKLGDDQPQNKEDSSSSSDEEESKPAGGIKHASIGIPQIGAGETDKKKLKKHQKFLKKMIKKQMMEHSKDLI